MRAIICVFAAFAVAHGASGSESTRRAQADGSATAPAGMPQLPYLFSGYALRPPWKVAGVDYYVGVSSGTVLKDPSMPGNLPADVTLNTSTNTLIVTASNVTIDGFDFSGRGGYGIYITSGVAGTKIINNLFIDSSPTSSIPVNIGLGASDTYIGYNTINAGGASGNQTFHETILNHGVGLTVEYNFIENAPGRFVSTDAGPLIYKFNLLENGGWLSGTHLNFLQFGGGPIADPIVAYNTLVQTITVSGGEGFQMYTNNAGSINNGDIGNNTIITKPRIGGSGATGPALSYLFHAGSSRQFPSPATGLVHDNYVDTSSAYGAVYPGLIGFTYSNNVNLLTGTRF